MTALKRCGNCGGEYPERQADGGVYVHACPPAPKVEPPSTRWERARAKLRAIWGAVKEG